MNRLTHAGVLLAICVMPILPIHKLAFAASIDEIELCSPSLFQNGEVFQGRYPLADAAFDKHLYKAAFKAYYQYFFCLNGNSETVNPAAEDSGAAQILRRSLQFAVAEHFQEASTLAKQALQQDGRFCEASFIRANLLFVEHKYGAANELWQATETVSSYAVSSGSSTTTCASAAREMLRRHESRRDRAHHATVRGRSR